MTTLLQKIPTKLLAIFILLNFLPDLDFAQRLNLNEAHLWKPVADDVYLQEEGLKALTVNSIFKGLGLCR